MNASTTATSDAPQASTRMQVLLPAAVEDAFDYLVPVGTPVGTLVEATLMNRKLVGVVWRAAPSANDIAVGKLKPATPITTVPPLPARYVAWLNWLAEFTLAPKGAVLSLCGLAHASKQPKKPLTVKPFTIKLPALTAGQQEAVTELGMRDWGLDKKEPLKPILLDGVTGSGKTEIYFHAIAEVLKQRDHSTPIPNPPKQILVLLPEIALTHQWLARFEKTFGTAPVVWHSRMTPASKARAWQAVARGDVQVVVGARSALFLPFFNLGLIIVDEEHDPSYKQEDGVLYHARDMAVARASYEQVPILLVSATPSLETLENVREGKYRAIKLPERFGAAGLPSVRLVDMRVDTPERGDFLSPLVKAEMLATLARGEQSLLFLNRRGYAPLLLCRGCGHRFECPDCSAWLVVHGGKRLECHHCGHKEKLPPECPHCKAPADKLAPCGPGVERIAEEVKAMFSVTGDQWPVTGQAPDHQSPTTDHRSHIALLSSDESIALDTWEQIEKGEIDIIVGTQMVAKGHHFPNLTFVAVVDADVGLSGADLRAGERTYQLLHQLGGRAGRDEKPGRVFIQTYEPQHPVMVALAAQNRDQLMGLEARERKAGNWPPYGQLAAILLDGVNEIQVRDAGKRLAQLAPSDARITILGPAPAPLSKLRGQYRYRLLVKAQKGINLQRTLRNWLSDQKFQGVRIKIDVNPYYFL